MSRPVCTPAPMIFSGGYSSAQRRGGAGAARVDGPNSPLHVVLLSYRDTGHPEAGGAESYLEEIFQRIARCGHRVTLICAGYRGASARDRIGDLDVLRVGNKATVNFAAGVAALRLARRQHVDLFVENVCKIPFLMPAFTSVPVLPIVPHLFGSTVFAEANPVVASYVWLSERLIPRVYRGLHFVVVSDSTARDLARRAVHASGLDIVPPGVDLRRYRPSGHLRRNETPLVLYVGRLKRYKGVDIVLRAFSRVRDEVPAARLVIVGKGDDRARLERVSRRLALGDAVTFEGFVTEEQKIDWLRRASVVVYPSPKEGWGIATIEAAACGTPVLASDSDGLRDAVRDGLSGFLVPHRDVDVWVRRMSQLLSDSTLRERMSTASVGWAQQFGWDAAADSMRGIVERVATGVRRR